MLNSSLQTFLESKANEETTLVNEESPIKLTVKEASVKEASSTKVASEDYEFVKVAGICLILDMVSGFYGKD